MGFDHILVARVLFTLMTAFASKWGVNVAVFSVQLVILAAGIATVSGAFSG